ncbi:MAG: hypothetical protein GF346_04640 [Candidatus Eisenbacteria bacterium]|nr:hypothetical protein [Candidatus Eisenbacteria bacterium]
MDAGPGRGWQCFHEVIERHTRFLLTSHIFPEGDSLGSEVALALHLRQRGKTVHVVNPTPPRPCFQFLLDLFPIHHLTGNGIRPIPDEVEVVVALDVGRWDYIGSLAPVLRESELPRVVIDHHHPSEDFGHVALVDPQASSTSEMIYEFLRWSGARIDPQIAQALYAGVMFDTGGLRLPQARNSTVVMVADLIRRGADHRTVTQAIFESESYARMELLRRALGYLKRERNGRIAWISIPDCVFAETGTTLQDGDGILDHLLSIREIDVCALFRESSSDGVRVTFRSKGRHDVGMIAAHLGGGGRPNAAGVFLPCTLEEAEQRILPVLCDLYEAVQVPVSSEAGLRD